MNVAAGVFGAAGIFFFESLIFCLFFQNGSEMNVDTEVFDATGIFFWTFNILFIFLELIGDECWYRGACHQRQFFFLNL